MRANRLYMTKGFFASSLIQQQQDRTSAGLAPHPCPPVLLCFPVTDLVRKIAHHHQVAHTAAGSNRQTRSREVRTATSRGTVSLLPGRSASFPAVSVRFVLG